jgi:hypothetical protein
MRFRRVIRKEGYMKAPRLCVALYKQQKQISLATKQE